MDISAYTDPCEYPDWRWSRIKGLLKDRKHPTDHDDKYIHRGFKFAKDIDVCDGSDTSMYSLSLKHRDVAKAVGLHNNKSNRKYFLESMALCWDTDEDHIAAYLGEHQMMVRYYLKLFFDVRDRLNSPGYICARIMEPALLSSIKDCKDPQIAWKLAGMFGGIDAVKSCWEARGVSRKVQKHFHDTGVSAMMKDFGLGTHLRPVNANNIEMIADHMLRLTELELKSQAISGINSSSEEKVNMLKDIMGSIKFFVADPGIQMPAREPRLFEKVDQKLVAAAIGE